MRIGSENYIFPTIMGNCLSLDHESIVGHCRIRLDFSENDRCRELCCFAAAARIHRRNNSENRRADMGSYQIHRLHGPLVVVRGNRMVVLSLFGGMC